MTRDQGVRPSDRRASATRRPRVALTVGAITAKALAILDAEGIEALTLRRLAGDLGVAAASMYWHVDDKHDLLSLCYEATTEGFVRRLENRQLDPSNWRAEVRGVLTELFDLIQEHPWLLELLSGSGSRGAVVRLVTDRIGAVLDRLGLDGATVFYAVSALVGHLGAVGLIAARNAYTGGEHESRGEQLARNAASLEDEDPDQYPYLVKMAEPLRDHSERDQFLGGVDLILDGLAVRLPERGTHR